MRFVLFACITFAAARIPSRASQSLLNGALGGRLQGAGLHSTTQRQPHSHGMKDLSWWPDSHATATASVTTSHRRRVLSAERASDEPIELFCVFLATCLGGLAVWVHLEQAGMCPHVLAGS